MAPDHFDLWKRQDISDGSQKTQECYALESAVMVHEALDFLLPITVSNRLCRKIGHHRPDPHMTNGQGLREADK